MHGYTLPDELAATCESYKKYQKAIIPAETGGEELVRVQAEALSDPGFKQIAWVNALTYQMIYEQPVCYEFSRLKVKTLLIIGAGGPYNCRKGKAAVPGNCCSGGAWAIPADGPEYQRTDSRLPAKCLYPVVGHIPHIQDFQSFKAAVSGFLQP